MKQYKAWKNHTTAEAGN